MWQVLTYLFPRQCPLNQTVKIQRNIASNPIRRNSAVDKRIRIATWLEKCHDRQTRAAGEQKTHRVPAGLTRLLRCLHHRRSTTTHTSPQPRSSISRKNRGVSSRSRRRRSCARAPARFWRRLGHEWDCESPSTHHMPSNAVTFVL